MTAASQTLRKKKVYRPFPERKIVLGLTCKLKTSRLNACSIFDWFRCQFSGSRESKLPTHGIASKSSLIVMSGTTKVFCLIEIVPSFESFSMDESWRLKGKERKKRERGNSPPNLIKHRPAHVFVPKACKIQ